MANIRAIAALLLGYAAGYLLNFDSYGQELQADDGLHVHAAEVICGPMSLTLAARQLGVAASVYEVASLSRLGPVGCSLRDLSGAARALGLDSEAVQLRGTQDLTRLTAKTPAIVQIRENHFALVWGSGTDDVIVADYPHQLQRLKHSSLVNGWDPRVLIIKSAGSPEIFDRRVSAIARWILIGAVVILVASMIFTSRRRRASMPLR